MIWTISICLLGVVAILVASAWRDESLDEERIAAEQARVVKYCNQQYEKMDSYVTTSGVAPEGKAWAEETLRTAPAELQTECPGTYNRLKEAVDGTIDQRLANAGAWDCYNKGHAEAWRSTGGLTIREWEDQLAAQCGVQGSIPGSKSAVSR